MEVFISNIFVLATFEFLASGKDERIVQNYVGHLATTMEAIK